MFIQKLLSFWKNHEEEYFYYILFIQKLLSFAENNEEEYFQYVLLIQKRLLLEKQKNIHQEIMLRKRSDSEKKLGELFNYATWS